MEIVYRIKQLKVVTVKRASAEPQSQTGGNSPHILSHAQTQGRLPPRGFIGPKLDLSAQNWSLAALVPLVILTEKQCGLKNLQCKSILKTYLKLD